MCLQDDILLAIFAVSRLLAPLMTNALDIFAHYRRLDALLLTPPRRCSRRAYFAAIRGI